LKRFRNTFLIILMVYCLQLITVSCNTIDLYEKSVSIPGHSWKNDYKPSFTFTIKDTVSTYELFLVLRHTDKYNYNNIWVNISVKSPGSDAVKIFKADKQLGSDEKGWLATGMDDIYEHRLALNDEMVNNNISLRKPGNYTFTLEQVMRENPLNNVLSVGLRIEKK
jgi:gliding motility-associated lipoprotein GldH